MVGSWWATPKQSKNDPQKYCLSFLRQELQSLAHFRFLPKFRSVIRYQTPKEAYKKMFSWALFKAVPNTNFRFLKLSPVLKITHSKSALAVEVRFEKVYA